MDDPFEILLDREHQGAPRQELLLATVASVTSDGLTIIPDGETEATRKKYKYMTSAYAAPAVGDRVVVMRLSGIYVILGRIGTSTPDSEKYVRRSGDTMTGALTMNGADINLRSTTNTIGTVPEATQSDRRVYFRDKLNTIFGKLQSIFTNNGRTGMQFGTQRTINGSLVENNLSLYIDESGSRFVALTVPQAWRGALGLGTNGNFPITVAQGGTGQTGVTITTNVSDIFSSIASGFTVNDAAYVQFGKVAMLSANLSSSVEGSTFDWTTWATLAAGKRPALSIAVNCHATTYCIISQDGKIQFSLKQNTNFGYRVSAIYLLP